MGEGDREFWNAAFREDPNQAVFEDHLLEAEFLDLQPRRALDLGCGSGAIPLNLAERGWSVVGVDWAWSAIELAREPAEARGLDATFLVADITEWEPHGSSLSSPSCRLGG